MSAARGAWPLVGRDGELAEIAAARADPECPAVLISAPAGVGKSRLAREAFAAAEADGARTMWAQATASSATIPLGALAPVIPAELRSGEPLELVLGVTEAMRARAGDGTVVLGVDDAQLLDDAPAVLVLNLATSAGVFVLVTVRSDARAPDAIDSLWKDAGARRIDLSPMSDTTIARMVEAGLGGPVGQMTLRRVVDAAAGNPLYARELVLGSIEDGRLTREHGLWRIPGPLPVRSSLMSLVQRRTAALSSEEREPLELLSLGEPLRLQELARLSSYEALAGSEERGMIAVSGPAEDAEVRLSHPLYGEVITAAMPVLRARLLRLALADEIQRRKPLTHDDQLRAARWLIDAGESVPTDLLLGAADAANIAGDAELGADLAARAVDAGAGLDAILLLARAYTIQNRFAEAESVLADAESTAQGHRRVMQYFGQRMHVLFWGLRRTDEAKALLERVEAWSDDPDWRGPLAPWRVQIIGLTEGFADSLETIRGLLSDGELEPSQRRAMELMLGLALRARGRMREAEPLAAGLRPQVPLRSNVDAYALGVACLVGEESGEDWDGFERYVSRTLGDSVRVGDREAAGFAALSLASLKVHRGHYRDADRWLGESEVQLEHHDTFGLLTCVAALRVGIACFTGDPSGARDALEEARRLAAQNEPRMIQLMYLACAEGWGAETLSAAAGAERFSEIAADTIDPTVRSRLLHEALRAGGQPDPIAAQLRELAAGCDCRLIDARAAHAVALAARDGESLVTAGEQLEAIGASAAAVDALVGAARLFLAEGRQDSARRAAARAMELQPAGQGTEFPTIDGLDGIAVELSPREAQIAALVARGLTNHEIAEQLVLSVRTVETYVYRAMQKRGVESRHEL
jgi:DNA-binding NarL/FixJ family response regulator